MIVNDKVSSPGVDILPPELGFTGKNILLF